MDNNRLDEFVEFLINSTLSGKINWITVSEVEFFISDPYNNKFPAIRLIIDKTPKLEIFKFEKKLYINPQLITPITQKLLELQKSIKIGDIRNKALGTLIYVISDCLLSNIIYSVLKNTEKRELEDELFQRLDNLILQLG
jgi:hypothetical protein